MAKTIQIFCKNNNKKLEIPIGSTLSDIFSAFGLEMKYGPICARVNNKVEGMHFRVYNPKTVEFLDITAPSGARTYTRTLFFVLCKAMHDLYDDCSVSIDTPVSNGYYVDLEIGRPVTLKDVGDIRARMNEIIQAALPIHRHETTTEEAISLFEKIGATSKVKLLKSTGKCYTVFYDIDGYYDYYYGALLTNTSQLYLFGVEFSIFREHHSWQKILGMRTIGDLNELIEKGWASQLIQVSEALQEKKIAQIADEIAYRKGIRMVLIAGPSSSGKTTTCKRLSVQLVTNGYKPVPISLDDYFVDREKTPRDETGDYDYEHLHSLNLPLLNEQLKALFAGEEIQLPKYNFQTGKSTMNGRRLKLHDDEILIVEGIHALNPELTAEIPRNQIYRVYASALTTLLLDAHNYIPTTDNRLGVSARETIHRWASVRAGENKWIFPFQENADAMFNTAMLFELAVIKGQAEPMLEQVPENCVEYAEAHRLLKFLKYIKPIPDSDIPPTSLLREFLGGSSFKY